MINEILDIIKNAEDVVIVGHVSPDGDSIGSCFAMAHLFDRLGKKPKVLLEDYSQKYTIIPGFEFVYGGDIDALSPDLFVVLDCGSKDRIQLGANLFDRAENTIVIDHHASNDNYGKFNYVDPKASSTCEMVYEIIINLIPLDKQIAACLYAGIVCDTGGFRFESVAPRTFEIAGELLKQGINITKICEELLIVKDVDELKAYLEVISTFKMVEDAKLSYCTITIAEMKRLGITSKELDSVSSFLLRARQADIAIFAYETGEGKTKLSIRSKAPDVNKLASNFGGGGHKLAAGCIIDAMPEEAIEIVLGKIREL